MVTVVRPQKLAWTRAGIVALALIGAACAMSGLTTVVASAQPAPGFAGSWTGTWAGTPLSLLLIPDANESSPSGIYVGPWLVLGQPRPSFSGVITWSRRGEPVSTHAHAWITYAGGAVGLLIQAAPTDGDQQLSLRSVDPQRFVGVGSSSFRWGPQGAVELHREVR